MGKNDIMKGVFFMSKTIRWGIIGLGGISHTFANALLRTSNTELVAVASRTKEKATEFANKYKVSKAYEGYENLAKDNEIDVVYVATPHGLHKEDVLLLLNNKKSVLCEKSFAMNEAEAIEMIECAKKNDVFIMEAMWTRFLPAVLQVNRWIDEGLIGEVKFIKTALGFSSKFDPEWRLYKRSLGGGALMDIGVYTASIISMVYKEEPEDIVGIANMCETEVDESAQFAMKYSRSRMAEMSISVKTALKNDVYIYGSRGYIHIPNFQGTHTAMLIRNDSEPMEFNSPFAVNGYEYEIMEVNNCIANGMRESKTMTYEDTLLVMRILDRMRKIVGVTYPNDEIV